MQSMEYGSGIELTKTSELPTNIIQPIPTYIFFLYIGTWQSRKTTDFTY